MPILVRPVAMEAGLNITPALCKIPDASRNAVHIISGAADQIPGHFFISKLPNKIRFANML
jgi:hypothetical protein